MKKLITVCFLTFAFFAGAFWISAEAETIPPTQQQTQPTYTSFFNCQKTFIKQSEPFFYVTLSALAKNNYKIEEIQSKNGLIIFKVYNKEFLANITKVDFKTTLLKITPADNNYNFSPTIVESIFKTIDEDLYKDIYKLN